MFDSKNLLRMLIVGVISLTSISAANAGWILATDPDSTDTATNPGYGSSQPSNQSAATIASWLQDLFDLANAPLLIAQDDSFSGSDVLGIPSAATYLTLHYGNSSSFTGRNLTLAYECSSDCGSFTGIDTHGLSNYRIFDDPPTTSVPEPATVALLGLALVGLGYSRHRKF